MSYLKAKIGSRVKTKKRSKAEELIVIDESKGLIFENDNALYGYFKPAIDQVETDLEKNRGESDFTDDELKDLEKHLDDVLDLPDQIWQDDSTGSEFPLHYFIKKIDGKEPSFDYIAICYMNQEDHVPTYVLSHFATKSALLTKKYRRKDLVYDVAVENVREASVEGDALGDGDELALGLYQAMMVVRAEKDILQTEFSKYSELREETIEHPDEIWKKTDTEGHGLVTFIKEFSEHATKDLHYVAVTLEDSQSQVHSLLFSFPTTDITLVDRYRQGENLQAEEVVQESSH
jgi:hypothetical protein